MQCQVIHIYVFVNMCLCVSVRNFRQVKGSVRYAQDNERWQLLRWPTAATCASCANEEDVCMDYICKDVFVHTLARIVQTCTHGRSHLQPRAYRYLQYNLYYFGPNYYKCEYIHTYLYTLKYKIQCCM